MATKAKFSSWQMSDSVLQSPTLKLIEQLNLQTPEWITNLQASADLASRMQAAVQVPSWMKDLQIGSEAMIAKFNNAAHIPFWMESLEKGNKKTIVQAIIEQNNFTHFESAFKNIDNLSAAAVLVDTLMESMVFDVKTWNFSEGEWLNADGQDEETQLIIDESYKIKELILDIYRDDKIIYKVSPREFEKIIAEILRHQGFDVELTKQTRDGGYDIVALRKFEHHRVMKFLVECKRWSANDPVGVDVIRAFKEVMREQNANQGIIATSAYFTKDAKKLQTPYLLDYRDKNDIMDWIQDYKNSNS